MAVALVGRGTEQAELTSTWQAARGGQAQVVGLAGPAGVGKTALVAQFLRDAAPARPVWVSGAPEERTLSWGVLGQAVPALGPARPGPPPVWAAPDPEADPLYVGQSFLDDVRAAGETILVLDDAHWADRQSQAALRFAARHMTGLPVLVIVIHNDEVPLDESWRRLFGSAHGSLVTLAGLTPEELVRLAVARGHFGLSPAAAARLHEHTGGNPLYASALLAQLPARDLAAGALPAPRSIVDTVAANLAGRSEPTAALLSAAAVLGRSFDVAQAGRSLACPLPGPAAAALDEAVAAGLAEEVPGTAGRRFAFSHALVHQAVYTRIALARRRELHRQAGSLLGEAEALRHRVAAADGPDPELAADLDRQAALDTVRGELAAASSRLQDALRLTPPGPARTPRLLAVVEAELIAGDTGRGEQALADLGARGLSPGLEPLVARGVVELWTDDLDGACRHLGEAVNRAYRGEPLRVSQALAFLGDAEYRRGQLADSVLHTELAVGDAEENERFWDYALLHGLACQTRAARGDWAQAEAHAAAAAQWAPLVGTRSGLFSAAAARAMIAQAQPDAAALLAAARDMEHTFDPAEPGIILLGPLRAEALVQLGRPSEADDALTAFGAWFAGTGRKSARLGIARARGRIAAAHGAQADALASYAEALELASDVGLPLEEGRAELLMAQCLAACGRYDPAGVRLRAAGRRFARIGAGAYLAQAAPGRPAGPGPGRPVRPADRADRRRAPGGAARPGGPVQRGDRPAAVDPAGQRGVPPHQHLPQARSDRPARPAAAAARTRVAAPVFLGSSSSAPPGPRTHTAGMRFFGGPPRGRKSRPLADPRYVADVLGRLTAVFDQALDLPRRRSVAVDTLVFGDVVSYFTGERPDDSRIKAGALLLSAGSGPGRVAFQVFLDEADQVCGDASGTPYGRRILARRLDAELTDYLGGGDLLIFQ